MSPIKRIVIQSGGKEYNLTIDQAKKLYEALEEIFGNRKEDNKE